MVYLSYFQPTKDVSDDTRDEQDSLFFKLTYKYSVHSLSTKLKKTNAVDRRHGPLLLTREKCYQPHLMKFICLFYKIYNV